MCNAMKKKVALFGYNRLSFEAILRLDLETYDLLVLDTDKNRVELAREAGVEAQQVDFRRDEDLKSAGIGKDIEILFCFFPSDGDNVFLILSARALDENLNIISIVDNPDSGEKLLAAGANKIIDPYEICARKIHQLIKCPDMTNILDHTVFGDHDLNMAEIKIGQDSGLKNSTISDLNLNEKYNLILIAIVNKEQGEDLYFSTEEQQHTLATDDILVVMGPSREINAFKKEMNHV